jgi:choline-sulfatase
MITEKPNIILLLSDEHCGYAMGHTGDPNLHTPIMDRLAAEGVSFERAYANCPICTPSRGTIFS